MKYERHEFNVWADAIVARAAVIASTIDPVKLRRVAAECRAAKCYGLADANERMARLVETDPRLIALTEFEVGCNANGNSTGVFFARTMRQEIKRQA